MNKKSTMAISVVALCVATVAVSQAATAAAPALPAGFSGTQHYLPLLIRDVTPLPTATDEPTQTPEPTQTQLPASVYVIGNTFAFADLQHIHVIGEVFNNTGGPVTLIKVTARLYNDSHQLMANDFNWTFVNHLSPQQKTCFDVSLAIPATWSTYEVDTPTYFEADQGQPNMAIDSPTVFFDPNSHHYDSFGQVRNDEQTPAHSVYVVQTLYDGNGAPLGCGYDYVGDWSPTQSGGFGIQFNNRNYSDVTSWVFQADADIQ